MTFRVVPDTNVVVAARRSESPESPNRELIRRFTSGEFNWLFSLDCLSEYAEKLLQFGITAAEIKGFLADIVALGGPRGED